LIATHSTEIISEADPDEILLVTKKAQAAKRVGDPSQLRSIFSTLGSNLNPTLTQLARTKRAVYVEGKDFQVMARFATKLGVPAVARRSDFAVVPTEGFNPLKARTFTEGAEATLASKISVAVIFDHDYRSDGEVAAELAELNKFCDYAHIHSKKELENFLLVPDALDRAITQRVVEQNLRTGKAVFVSESSRTILLTITDVMKHDVQAQCLKRQHPFAKSVERSLVREDPLHTHRDDSTLMSELLAAFDDKWGDLNTRLDMVPGKEVLSQLNTFLQKAYGVTVTPTLIIDCMEDSDVAAEMKAMILSLQDFAKRPAKSSK